jgi:hypothetical protein
MKNSIFLLLVVVAALCVTGWTAQAKLQRSSSARQAWEYKSVSVARGVEINGAWSVWVEDDKRLPGPVTITAKIQELGDQGWEMVSATPLSSHSCGSGDCAGFTSQVTFLFKRPK